MDPLPELNDTIPTAPLSSEMEIEEALLLVLKRPSAPRSSAKEQELWPVRQDRADPPIQDATPILLGQEFRGYVEESLRRAKVAQAELLSVPLGRGPRSGLGINALRVRSCARAAPDCPLTGLEVARDQQPFPRPARPSNAAIAAIRRDAEVAVAPLCSLWKIASDVRLMGMGPRAGIAEVALPETQPGSSIMPGKVNPVIVESLTMVVAGQSATTRPWASRRPGRASSST